LAQASGSDAGRSITNESHSERTPILVIHLCEPAMLFAVPPAQLHL